MSKKKISVEKVLSTVGHTARRKAFKKDRPVAITDKGLVYFLYADGHREPATAQSFARLAHGKA